MLRHGGARGADFTLVNTDDKDDIFSLIEVHRGRLETPVLLPPLVYKVSDQDPRPPKAQKAGEPVRERKGKRKGKADESR